MSSMSKLTVISALLGAAASSDPVPSLLRDVTDVVFPNYPMNLATLPTALSSKITTVKAFASTLLGGY